MRRTGPGSRSSAPAGKLLDRALAEAGIDPGVTYTTNAVKHFRWRPAPGGGKRRIHQRPDTWQVRACWPWLEAELARLAPSVVVTLGATAGQALFGSSFRVTSERGTRLRWCAPALRDGQEREVTVVPTIHPSAVLRAEDREAAYAGLVSDLRVAAAALPAAPVRPAPGRGATHASWLTACARPRRDAGCQAAEDRSAGHQDHAEDQGGETGRLQRTASPVRRG